MRIYDTLEQARARYKKGKSRYVVNMGGFLFNALVNVLLHEKSITAVGWQNRLILLKPSQISFEDLSRLKSSFCGSGIMLSFGLFVKLSPCYAGIAQLVERYLAKV